MVRTRRSSAKENGPGASGAGGGGSLMCGAAAISGIAIHGFCGNPCQHTKVSRPPGLRAVRRFVKAAVGFAKNMTPTRENRRAKVGEKAYVWASASSNVQCGQP